MEFPGDLKYTQEHEWIRVEGNVAIIGITDYAQGELGDIVYVEVETIDETLAKDDVFGSVEAVKTVSDLYMPISGKIIEFNESLEETPETVNEDPYGNGWMIKVEMSDTSELEALMDATAYKESIG